MTTLLQDLRYALRALAKSPGFTLAAIVILALGIGANTAIFSLMDAIVLRPLPGVVRPSELVDVSSDPISFPSYKDMREEAKVFAGVAAWRDRGMSLSSTGVAERIRGAVVSPNYFDVLGVRPASGRFFVAAEEESAEPIVVLAHGLWQTRFGADPGILGRSIRLNGIPFTVVGLAPQGFRGTGFASSPDLWVPIGAWPRLATGSLGKLDIHMRNWGWLSVLGRLKPGVSLREAEASLGVIARRDAEARGDSVAAGFRVTLQPTIRAAAGFGQSGDPVRFFAVLVGAVAAALLIACANLANLLLARAAGRRREIAVRQALGASRGRLLRQLLTESVALGILGGAAGLIVAKWSLGLLAGLPLPGDLSLAAFAPRLDPRALAFSFVLSSLTGVAFGLFPALQASRTAVASALKTSSTTTSSRSRLKSALIVAQVSLCLLLLVAAGLLARSLQRALAIDLGFQPRDITLASVHLGLARYDAPRAAAFVRELPRRIGAIPGVAAVSWVGNVPLSTGSGNDTVTIEGYTPKPGEQIVIEDNAVGAGFLRTMGIPLVSGREFDDGLDREETLPVAVVNEAMARRYWPGTSPIGRRLRLDTERTIVGVARDSRSLSLSERPAPVIYFPLSQTADTFALADMTLLVRAAAPTSEIAKRVRDEVRRLDASLPVTGIRSYEEEIGAQLLPQRLGTAMLGLFGLLSLGLAAVGIYAVVSFSVAGRTREIGIRMALGARAQNVWALVVAQSAVPLAYGLAIGLVLGAASARFLRGFLYGLSPSDPVTFVGVTILLGACGLFAAWLPARRASRIDPMTALRGD